jgi:hypothetical protein
MKFSTDRNPFNRKYQRIYFSYKSGIPEPVYVLPR